MIIPPPDNFEETQISPFLSFQWIREGKAFFIKIRSSQRAQIDLYIDANLQAMALWDKTQTFYSIQDVSDPEVVITPYFRQRLEEITVNMKASKLQGHSVIMVNNGIFGRAVQLYGRLFARKAEPIYQHWVLSQERAFETLDRLMAQKA